MTENEYVPEEFKTKKEFIDRIAEVDKVIEEIQSNITGFERSMENIEGFKKQTRKKLKNSRGGMAIMSEEKERLQQLMADRFPS
jgi:hypothetical protein